jgi:integrase
MNATSPKITISQPAEFPDRKLPYAVRWRLNGRGYWRSFATKRGKNGADAFYALLSVAAMNERDWDSETGMPASMSAPSDMNVAEYCRDFVKDEWQRLSPSTRKSYVEALASFIVNCRRSGAPHAPTRSAGILTSWLTPRPEDCPDDRTTEWIWSGEPLPRNIESWIGKNSPLLADLNREILFETDKWMRLRPDGATPYAPTTQNRLVTVAKLALSVAVKRGLIENVPWPRRDSGATAKSDRRATIDVLDGQVPSVAQLLAILDAMPSHQPASHLYRTMSAICGFAGLRPGEVVALEVEDLYLPLSSWGTIRITKAWSGVDGGKWNSALETIADPKTQRSRRTVPIPPLLVEIVREWLERSGTVSGPLFLTREGSRPTQSNWRRALHRACIKADWTRPLSPYELRRTNASHLVQAIPIAEAAARLGHSVDVLTKHYVKRVSGQTELSNQILERAYFSGDQSSARPSNHSSRIDRRIRN